MIVPELIDEARAAAASLQVDRMDYTAVLLRQLADALAVQQVELDNRKQCHEEALGAVREALDVARSLKERLDRSEGFLAAIRAYPKPEGWVFKAVIDCLREWRRACGRAPFYVAAEDLDQLEEWGTGLLEAHDRDRMALTNPARRGG